MITLMQLEVFATAAELQHFTRAAEALHLTQPAVTFQIRNLERALGMALFEVRGRRVYLTEAGRLLQERAAVVLREVAATEAVMREYRALGTGRLELGATRTIGSYVLPDLLARFRAQAPGVELAVSIDNTATVEERLLARALDLALVEGEVASRELDVRPFQDDELVLLAPPGDPLADWTEVSLDALRGRAFVCREPGSGTQALAERTLGSVLAEAPSRLVLDSPEAINRAVAAGLGLAVQSSVIAERDVAAGRLRALRVQGHPMHRQFSAVTLRGRVHSPATRSFLGLLGVAP